VARRGRKHLREQEAFWRERQVLSSRIVGFGGLPRHIEQHFEMLGNSGNKVASYRSG
jgi:hypothetical protein